MERAPGHSADEAADRGALKRGGARLAVLAAMLQFVALGFAAALWWWAMPKGFPIWHARFAMNVLLPIGFLSLSCAAICSGLLTRTSRLRWCQGTLLVLMLSAGITGLILFPRSMFGLRLLTVVAIPLSGVMAVSGLVHFHLPRGRVRPVTFLPAVLVGMFVPWSQRGADPATIPSGANLSGEVARGHLEEPFSSHPTTGVVLARNGKLSLEINPVLKFTSISPDRFWTLFSPVRPTSVGVDSRLGFSQAGGTLRIDATSELEQAVYSHLNSYTSLLLHGSESPTISFSACPEPIQVLPSDYPVGRPARFACLKKGNRFEVLEADSGEKGPFATLAAGSLSRSESLVITINDGKRPAVELKLRDWSAQASTQLSPTAGWGVPENAIEFSRSDSGKLVMINITLAGTSVGRGWDSVGHAPGVYRNRIEVTLLGAR